MEPAPPRHNVFVSRGCHRLQDMALSSTLILVLVALTSISNASDWSFFGRSSEVGERAPVLRCYTCTTAKTANCDDPFNSSGVAVADCVRHSQPSPYVLEVPVCKKVKQRINNGDLQTVRNCAWVRPEEQRCNTTDQTSYIHEEYCVMCDSDLCNGAQRRDAVVLSVAAPVSIVLAVEVWRRTG